MTGLEYLREEALAGWWADLDALVRDEVRQHAGGAQAYLSEKNPLWRFVGRVTLHLAENKRDAENPFAFLATYVSRLSAQGRVQHEPLGRALQQYAGARNRQALLSLLVPIQRAAERSALVKELVDSGDVYHPLAWSPREAHRFLQDIPDLRGKRVDRPRSRLVEAAPPAPADRQRADRRPARVQAGGRCVARFLGRRHAGRRAVERGRDSGTAGLGRAGWSGSRASGSRSTARSWPRRSSTGKPSSAGVRQDGLSFFEGMRLLAGAALERDVAADAAGSDARRGRV